MSRLKRSVVRRERARGLLQQAREDSECLGLLAVEDKALEILCDISGREIQCNEADAVWQTLEAVLETLEHARGWDNRAEIAFTPDTLPQFRRQWDVVKKQRSIDQFIHLLTSAA